MRARLRLIHRCLFAFVCCAAALAGARAASSQTPSPTPTPSDDYGPEAWEPYVPPPEQVTLELLGCGGRTFAKVRFAFHSGGYRVADPGRPERTGDDFSVDARLERWTGVITLSPFNVDQVYDLGTLAPGSYTFTLRSRGTLVKGVSFAAGPGPAANLSDDPTVFLWQHYLDFLGREPDEGGLHFWRLNLASGCNGDPACLERRRVNVSAAFFLSIEFQRTGFYVYRMHKAAAGQMPRMDEFLADTRRTAGGVVVGRAGWEALLEENQRRFAEEFVARAEFRRRYPETLTPAEYVDALNDNISRPFRETEPGALSNSEREDLISGLASGAETRATVLLKMAAHPDFVKQEFDPAFVLMQYFGYLRRNPDEGRDADWDGYNHWLGKLDTFRGNFVEAEMVKAFLTSDEYRQRFRP